ncbi:MAG: glycosyltransferase [Propionibacteriaceae bacterium]|nr:glycosyltransferase [Propionibacteriaceae bacterium]
MQEQVKDIARAVQTKFAQRPALRHDPIPPEQPYPDAQYVFLVGAVPRKYAGRTASILHKTRLWYEHYGIESLIVPAVPTPEMDDLEHHFRETGALADGVRIKPLLDFYPDDTVGTPVLHELEEPGLRWLKEESQPVYRFYDDMGVYRVYKRLDYAGRLIVKDYFGENRIRTRRDEFRTDGTLRRSAFMDPQLNEPRQEILYAHDGTPQYARWTLYDQDDYQLHTQRIVFFGPDGAPVREEFKYDPIIHTCLDQIVGDKLTFITCEDRKADREFLTYANPNVRKLVVYHNTHIKEPYTDIHSFRPMFMPLLSNPKKVDAEVFLTESQRADVEAHFGKNEKFRVIPHTVHDPVLAEGVERDPNLVIMMARLHPQKHVEHAIEAFKYVVKAKPQARLEIYGRGDQKLYLESVIRRMGVGDSVKLMGFTDNPSLVYQRASVCILTSRYEGQSLTVLEALMHSCPMVSYDLRYGPSEFIQDGVNGFLVPNRSIRALAKRVVQILDDKALRDRMVANARPSVEKFDTATFLRRWGGLLNELAGKK